MNPSLRFIRQDVQGMHAYAVQDASGLIKLDAMENPYALPPELQTKLGERLGCVAINRYPGPRVDALKAALAKYVQLPSGYELMLGNGSDELISLLAMACDAAPNTNSSGAAAKILAPLPGFVMYEMSAQQQGLQFIGVDLSADFQLDEAAMLAAIAREQPAITYLAYPNNPTANLWRTSSIDAIIQACASYGGLVVMDEAYQPFSSDSYAQKMQAHSNVLLMRTLSKFGLAGVRLGYMFGPADIIGQVNKLRPPYNISQLNAECALFALEYQAVFAAQAREICAQRAMLLEALGKLPGVQAFKSDANMILTRVPSADKTFANLKARGVLVKNVSKMHSLLANCLRLTVGTPAENQQLLAALSASL
jgi:histidinol-phosphate aminotransferase